jgi:hypothetical protein
MPHKKKQKNKSPKITKDYWPTEGADHHDISPDALYQDKQIKHFLSGNQRTFLIASKGMGKTLLLRAKKKLLEEDADGSLVIPSRGEADIPEWKGPISGSPPDTVEAWGDIWTASILFSILTHRLPEVEGMQPAKDIRLYFDEMQSDQRFLGHLNAAIDNKLERPPSYFVGLLLERPKDTIARFLATSGGLCELTKRFVRHDVTMFIDAVDNSLTEKFAGNLTVWCNAQTALLHAAYRLNISNRHIHVYASIRQEAWSSFEHVDRAVIAGKSAILEFTVHDLKPMFELAIKRYTGHADIVSFFGGIDAIPNGRSGEKEVLFDYIYRHSVGTSRSVMQIGAMIDRQDLKAMFPDEASRLQMIRSIVNIGAASQAYNDYLISQKSIFLSALHEPADIDALLALIPANILRGSTLKTIERAFLVQKDGDPRFVGPFNELFNNGLLGIVEVEVSTQKQKQRFKKPHEFDWKNHKVIQQNDIYLIHPSLQGRIRHFRPNSFHVNPSNVVGDGRAWNSEHKIFPKIFLSHSHKDKPLVRELRDMIKGELDMVMPCDMWLDEKDISAGQDIGSSIEHGLSSSDLVLLFISRDSLNSHWVEREWRTKYYEEIETKEIRVICCIIDGSLHSSLPEFLKTKHSILLAGDKAHLESQTKKLVEDISITLASRWSV